MAAHPRPGAAGGRDHLPVPAHHRACRPAERQDPGGQRARLMVAAHGQPTPPRPRAPAEIQDRRHRAEPRHRTRTVEQRETLVRPGTGDHRGTGGRDPHPAGGDRESVRHERQGIHQKPFPRRLRDPRREERARQTGRPRHHGRTARTEGLGRMERVEPDHEELLERAAMGHQQRGRQHQRGPHPAARRGARIHRLLASHRRGRAPVGRRIPKPARLLARPVRMERRTRLPEGRSGRDTPIQPQHRIRLADRGRRARRHSRHDPTPATGPKTCANGSPRRSRATSTSTIGRAPWPNHSTSTSQPAREPYGAST